MDCYGQVIDYIKIWSLRWNKRRILLSCCHVSKITWLHHLEKKLNGNYTRILHAVLNKSWKQHFTRQKLYCHLSLISHTNQVRQARHTGYCSKKRHFPMDSDTRQKQCEPTSKNLHSSALCKQWILSRGLAKSDGWSGQTVKESQGNFCCWHALMMIIMMMIHDSLKI